MKVFRFLSLTLFCGVFLITNDVAGTEVTESNQTRKIGVSAEKGQFNKITSMFLNRYILPNSRKYQDMVKRLMARTGDRVLPNADINDVSVKISSATIGFRAALKRMFQTVINAAYAPGVFTRLGITGNGYQCPFCNFRRLEFNSIYKSKSTYFR